MRVPKRPVPGSMKWVAVEPLPGARREHEVAREPRVRDIREYEVTGRQLLSVGTEEARLAKRRDRLACPSRVVPSVVAECWRSAPWLDTRQLRRNDKERW